MKALAGPTATVTAVAIAAKFAVRGFRHQKLIERRLGWYEMMFQQISEAGPLLTAASGAPLQSQVAQDAQGALQKLAQASLTAPMYAGEAGFAAVDRLAKTLAPLMGEVVSPKTIQVVYTVCVQTLEVLARECRKEFPVRQLREH